MRLEYVRITTGKHSRRHALILNLGSDKVHTHTLECRRLSDSDTRVLQDLMKRGSNVPLPDQISMVGRLCPSARNAYKLYKHNDITTVHSY